MRCADIFMSFPNMILILVLASVLGQSVTTVTLVIGFLGWTEFARLIYASVLSVREKDYVESAKAIGAKNGTILLRYVLPNSFAPYYHFLYIQNRSGDHYRVILKFLRTWRTASGSFLGKHSVLCTVHQCPVHKAVYVGTRRCCTGPYCIEH